MIAERKKPQSVYPCRIVQNRPVAQNQWQLIVDSENMALPDFDLGNFSMLSIPDRLEPLTPRPFAIVDHSGSTYTFIYKVTGKLTRSLTQLTPGTRVDLLGPLGRGFPRRHFESGVHNFIAGGVGYASLLPLIEETQRHSQAKGYLYYGVRAEIEVIRRGPLKPEFASDDGSIGLRGRVTDLLKGKTFGARDYFYVCGPTPMMKAVADLIPLDRSYFFLEEAMGCGFGICVGCVIPIRTADDKLKNIRSCMEGPIFLGNQLSEWRQLSWH